MILAHCDTRIPGETPEPMARLDVISYDPYLMFKEKLSSDRKFLTIDLSAIGGLPNEMNVEIELLGMDMAGNELQPSKYSFTTRKNMQ